MTDYRAALEALDAKVGRVHTIDDYRRISEKAPASVTDDDLVVLAYFIGEPAAASARVRREKALAPPPVDNPPETKTATPAPRFVTRKTLGRHFDAFGTAIVTVLKEALAGRDSEIESLKAEVEKLKARPLQKWAGVHVAGTQYAEASLVTRQGSLWVSTAETTTTPGVEGSDWRLIVKRGGA